MVEALLFWRFVVGRMVSDLLCNCCFGCSKRGGRDSFEGDADRVGGGGGRSSLYWSLWLHILHDNKMSRHEKMARQVYINDITNDMEDWRVKVLVYHKSNGTKVEGVLWNQGIDLLEGSLRPFMTYIIGDAQVQPIRAGFAYNTPGITTQWTISRDTFIRPVTEEAERLPYPVIHSPNFADIPKLSNTGSNIDVVAIVIDVKEPKQRDVKGKQTAIRECTIIQNETGRRDAKVEWLPHN